MVFGGSQLGGGNPTGQFGSLDLVALGAPNNGIPAGVTCIVDGVTQSAYDAVHGVEPGLIEGAREFGHTANLKVLCRYVDATSASDWVNTNFATVAADVVTASMTPALAIYATGGQDALSNNTIGQVEMTLRTLHGMVRSTWPNCGFAVSGLMSTDLTSFPKQPQLRAVAQRLFSLPADNRQCYVDPTDFQQYLVSDSTHLTSAGIVQFGLHFWRLIERAGIPG